MPLNSKRPTYIFVLPWSITYPGGVNQVVINLAKEMLRSNSYEPLILISDWEAKSPIWETVDGLKTLRWRIRSFNLGMGMKEKLAFWLWKIKFKLTFREFCEKHQVIVINQHYANSTAFTFDLLLENGKAAKIPLIISFHGADLTTIDSAPLAIRKRWRNLLLSSKAVVTCSENLASRVKETFGEDVTSKVIYNGVNFAEFLGSAKNPRPSEGRTILSVGKFEEKKGQDILIRAFASLCNLYPDLNLTLVGATDLHLTKLKNLCTEYKIESRVRFFADIPHTEIANFFQSASIFVLPSRQEPFGIVLLEAGCFSLPIVATEVGGIPEILTNGINGQLVPPDNPEKIATALRHYLDNPNIANAMANAFHDNITSKFTWANAHKKYVNLISPNT